ncbi:polysaccharide deacetylase family protein [Pullulanibacillus sp. KACC 23026]|uniref:polysaccharide deacetylase family protein n=1 Tax=Pullulanibacillus sp. KACC 23026 TaxID=3028315 RepID=UPI0023AFA4F9|nr:polysaccharide deacetylase family protein [Pullulanibacillus sp. KACC 23026]WEG12140.1 polysaccharide deacetylase family protein [Pullulanibacillus sp. KACC 23026]
MTITAVRWLLRIMIIGFFLFSFNHSMPPFSRHPIPILVYHLLGTYPGHGEKALYVSPKNFEAQMNYLKQHGFTPLTFEDWGKASLVKKPIFITFDDGYKDNTKMWAIFNKVKSNEFEPKATIFVISGDIGKHNHLNQTDIQSMAKSPFFSIQSHTVTHPNLARSKDLDYELGKSKQVIQNLTGKPVVAIAYPYGLFNAKVIRKASHYYNYGLTTLPGFYHKLWIPDENYLLPRIYVKYTTTINQFAHLVTPGS